MENQNKFKTSLENIDADFKFVSKELTFFATRVPEKSTEAEKCFSVLTVKYIGWKKKFVVRIDSLYAYKTETDYKLFLIEGTPIFESNSKIEALARANGNQTEKLLESNSGCVNCSMEL